MDCTPPPHLLLAAAEPLSFFARASTPRPSSRQTSDNTPHRHLSSIGTPTDRQADRHHKYNTKHKQMVVVEVKLLHCNLHVLRTQRTYLLLADEQIAGVPGVAQTGQRGTQRVVVL